MKSVRFSVFIGTYKTHGGEWVEASTSGQQQSRVSQNESGAISYTGMFRGGSDFHDPPCHKV